MDSAQRLKAAKTAVQAGQRQQARAMLQQLVADEPHHELAWLWLSDLAPDLEARIFALEQALAINPHRTRARQRLAALRQQHTAQAEQAAAHARQAAAQDRALALNGQRHAAYALLGERLRQQPDDAAAWRRLGELADAVEDQIVALTYALALEPAHVPARHRLTQLQRAHEDALAIGSAYERFGDLDNAIRFYRLAQKASDSSPDALIAQKRLQAARRFRKLYRRQKRPFSLPPLS
ncbi:MAG: hypothetical protein KC425_16155, partial [Anaerolineales bacterium]|nr:hypothetical protein [Anaerolineales bacterium]